MALLLLPTPTSLRLELWQTLYEMRQAQLLKVDLSNCEYNGKYFNMESLWLKQIIHMKKKKFPEGLAVTK